MTPIFWKYLITNCDGSAIRFVAEQERDEAEKELEGDVHLLSYRAKPQIQFAVFPRPSERVLQRLRRTRTQSEDASQELAELRRDGLPAFTVDQRSRHTQADPDECPACRADIKQSINPLPAFERKKRTT